MQKCRLLLSVATTVMNSDYCIGYNAAIQAQQRGKAIKQVLVNF